MADNELTVVRADDSIKTLRSRDVGSQVQAQKVDVAAWQPTSTGTSQYALSVTTASVVTLTVPSGTTHFFITVKDNDVHYTENGDTPETGASGDGHLLPAGFIGELPIVLESTTPQDPKFIAVSATALLDVSYRKYV